MSLVLKVYTCNTLYKLVIIIPSIIYPEFSIQEIDDIMYLFRWHYDVKTESYSLL